MNPPKVSIVTITYGHEKYIRETLEGVFMQQYTGLVEFIIANDCSPDQTDQIITSYLHDNQKPENFEIKYTRHNQNIGMSSNLIWAMKQCTGAYIAACEGDDYWTDPLKLQKQVEFLEQYEEYGLSHTNYQEFYECSNIFKSHVPAFKNKRTDENLYYLTTGDIRSCTVLFRAEYLAEIYRLMTQKFMKNAAISDRPIFLLIGKQSKLHFLNEITSVYRISSTNSASHFSNIFDYYDYLKKTAEINYEALKYLGYTAEIYNKYNDRIKYFNLFLLMKLDRLQFYREFLIDVILMKLSISQIKEILSIYRKV